MGAKKRLTQKQIDAAKPADKEYRLTDVRAPGFHVRVRTSGTKTFGLQFRDRTGRQRHHTIGDARIFSLSEALSEARSVLQQIKAGSDPSRNKADPRFTSVHSLYLKYKERRIPGFSPGHQVRQKSIFENIIIPWLGHKPVSAVSRHDVQEITYDLLECGKPAMANNVHRSFSSLFTWSNESGYLPMDNPLRGLKPPYFQPPRTRYLNESELVTLWHETSKLDERCAAGIQLLMLTGQRKNEVFGAETCEFDARSRIWTIPKHRTKNRYEQKVYLTEDVLAVLDGIPRIFGQKFLLQSKNSTEPRPAPADGRACRKIKSLVPIKDWCIHDLRRSVATHMASLGVDPHVIQVVLNHRGETRRGVTAIYNQYQYDREAKDAWELWARTLKKWIEEIPAIEPPPPIDDDEIIL